MDDPRTRGHEGGGDDPSHLARPKADNDDPLVGGVAVHRRAGPACRGGYPPAAYAWRAGALRSLHGFDARLPGIWAWARAGDAAAAAIAGDRWASTEPDDFVSTAG